MVRSSAVLTLALATLTSTAALAAPRLVPAGDTVPPELARYVRVVQDTEAAAKPLQSGTWTLTLPALGTPAADHTLTLEVAPTPDCAHNVAVFYSEGQSAGVAPASPDTGLDVSIPINGKHYLVSLQPSDDTHAKGVVQDFASGAKTSATAVFVGPATKLDAQPVTVGVNMLPFEVKNDDGSKSRLVRSPDLGATTGDYVTHPDAKNAFACYLLSKDGNEAFAYSDDPVFIVLALDAAGKTHGQIWTLEQDGTTHQAAQPLPVSISNKDGASLDFLPKS